MDPCAPPFHPTSNAVAERFAKTFKYQLKNIYNLNTRYSSKKTFMTELKKRVQDYNYQACLKRSRNLPPAYLSFILRNTSERPPSILRAANMKEDNHAVKDIIYFKDSAINEFKRTDLYRKYGFDNKNFLYYICY